MSDREDCTVPCFPESWEDQPACREAFLVHLPADVGEAFQKIGRFFFTALLEAHMSDADPADIVRGAAADLYHVCLVLKSMVEGYGELQLLNRVTDWQERVCSIADEMREMTAQKAP